MTGKKALFSSKAEFYMVAHAERFRNLSIDQLFQLRVESSLIYFFSLHFTIGTGIRIIFKYPFIADK